MGLIFEILKKRRRLRARESWSRRDLEAFQNQEFQKLFNWSVAHSPFLKKFYAGYEGKPLTSLPILTKSILMENYDSLVTDREVRLNKVESHLNQLRGDELFRGRYWVTSTSGSTGKRGIFLHNRDEWTTVLASYSRSYEWGGVQADLFHRVRTAVVSSHMPWHQSARVGMTVKNPWLPTLRLDALDPIEKIVADLERFNPKTLIGYANMMVKLAQEQIAGHLKIQPSALFCASEVLTAEGRRLIREAWGQEPFNVYAATETSTIASECREHRGMHLYEDLVITEAVDSAKRSMPAGEYSEKVLVTALFSRTLPLIRYEMSDSVAPSARTCPCGLPFALLEGVEGRAEDVLKIQSGDGAMVEIHPNVFHSILEPVVPGAWQVVQEAQGLKVMIQGTEESTAKLSTALHDALSRRGAENLKIDVERVHAIPKTKLGKTKLIVGYTGAAQ